MSRDNSTFEWSDQDRRAVDVIRALAMDAVEEAGSGHPGTAMSLAPAAYLLFQRFLRHDPTDPNWAGRDRFVLSCGHSSLTLYIQLYLSGYPMTLEDLKALRKWGSLTPGHPEYGHTAGVETTTGPLGQGLANAVGMAMAARRERGLFDPPAPRPCGAWDRPALAARGHRHADSIREALPERPRGPFTPAVCPYSGWPGVRLPPLALFLQGPPAMFGPPTGRAGC